MICTTTRKGQDCFFMAKGGCSYVEGTCLPVVPQCEGCGLIITIGERKYCKSIPEPASKWGGAMGCNLGTHVVRRLEAGDGKKINPLKASKKSMKGGK